MHRYSLSFTLIQSPSRLQKQIMESYVNAGTGMGAAAVFERGSHVDNLCNAKKIETNNLLSKDVR